MSGKKKPTTPKPALVDVMVEPFETIDISGEIYSFEDVEYFDVPILVANPSLHVVTGKDTWASIAALYCPKDKTVDEYYLELFTLNGKPQLVKGMTLKVA